MSDSAPDVPRLLRELAPQVLGIVARKTGDFTGAEDAVQEALLAASLEWPRTGLPEKPRAWLVQVAFRRRVDRVRSEIARRVREEEIAAGEEIAHELATNLDATSDDTLDLLFMCSHPSLSPTSAIALTLRAVGGLTTEEIAKAFLVPVATMAQRISRAKATLAESGASLAMPEASERAERLGAVMHTLYLIFNEGYAASSGASLRRDDLASEAIRLTRALVLTLPEETEAAGLLALMLLTDARRLARTGPNGELVPLDEQDRSRWDASEITEGVALLGSALVRGAAGSYQIQAAIAAVHDEAASYEATDWPQILGLYGLLVRMSDNPVVALNHAVALAMVRGPEAGLERLDALASDPRFHDHHRLYAARAHLLERAGVFDRAAAAYRRAAAQTTSLTERDYLTKRAARADERAR
ncbi:MAG TPA: DUF6596 domain-containing protein [Polyangiaceae bacterium]